MPRARDLLPARGHQTGRWHERRGRDRDVGRAHASRRHGQWRDLLENAQGVCKPRLRSARRLRGARRRPDGQPRRRGTSPRNGCFWLGRTASCLRRSKALCCSFGDSRARLSGGKCRLTWRGGFGNLRAARSGQGDSPRAGARREATSLRINLLGGHMNCLAYLSKRRLSPRR